MEPIRLNSLRTLGCTAGDQGWATDDGPLGNLRYDSALMGAISSQKGQKVPANRVPVSTHCLHNLG